MKLKKLLQLQVSYYLLGMVFNAVSFYLIYKGSHALTPNDPTSGCIAMTIYATFLIPGFLKKITLYRILMLAAIILLGYGGVFNHINLVRETPELYHSVLAGVVGISINIFGLILNIIAALGRFEIE